VNRSLTVAAPIGTPIPVAIRLSHLLVYKDVGIAPRQVATSKILTIWIFSRFSQQRTGQWPVSHMTIMVMCEHRQFFLTTRAPAVSLYGPNCTN